MDPKLGENAGRGFFSEDEIRTAEETLSPEQAVEQTATKWARLFGAKDPAACELYMTQPGCERIKCERVSGIAVRNCTLLSSARRKSFEDATVQDVAIRGNRAAAKLSNGETIELDHMARTRGAAFGGSTISAGTRAASSSSS